VKREYKIEVARDGRWWMVHIPEIDGITQARRLGEAEAMAREYIALHLGIPIDTVKVETASVRTEQPQFRELLSDAREVEDLRAKAREADRKATEATREYAQWLTTHGIPVRDIADLLKISPQRVSQLANS
jgi:predicted RNase H-like HicB family nuclease/predicted XRE-type DNA-binding protein